MPVAKKPLSTKTLSSSPWACPILVPFAVVALALGGCLAREEPVPPEEALARAARRIDAILAEDRVVSVSEQTFSQPQDPSEPGRVRFWYCTHPNMAPLIGRSGLVAAFNKSHPGTELLHQYIGDWHIGIQKLTVGLAAGDLPDVALVNRAWFARLIAAGRIVPLEDLLPVSLLDDLRPRAIEAFSHDGHLYGLPADGFCSVLFYNRSRIESTPPSDWEHLAAIARALGPVKERTSDSQYPLGHMPFLEALWSAGGHVCDASKSGLNETPAHNACLLYTSPSPRDRTRSRMPSSA